MNKPNLDLVSVSLLAFLVLLFTGCSGIEGGGVKETSSIPKEFHGTWTWNEDGGGCFFKLDLAGAALDGCKAL